MQQKPLISANFAHMHQLDNSYNIPQLGVVSSCKALTETQ